MFTSQKVPLSNCQFDPFSGSRSLRSHLQQASTDDNDDNDSITAQFGDFQDEAARGPIEPDVTARSLSTVDANILRPQELPDSGIGSTGLDSDAPSNNDHNYTLSPGLDAYLLLIFLRLSLFVYLK